MNKDQLEGGVKDLAGRAKQAVGDLADDPEMKAQGAAREAEGKVQRAYGDAMETVREYAKSKPFGVLAVGVGIGVLIGTYLLRRGDD